MLMKKKTNHRVTENTEKNTEEEFTAENAKSAEKKKQEKKKQEKSDRDSCLFRYWIIDFLSFSALSAFSAVNFFCVFLCVLCDSVVRFFIKQFQPWISGRWAARRACRRRTKRL